MTTVAVANSSLRPQIATEGGRALDPLALLDLVRCRGPRTTPWRGRPLDERVYELVELTDEVEVWVIHWPTGGQLQLHDHGGSAGAFWVVSGVLTERFHAPGEDGPGLRRHGASSGVAFGGRYLHDVRNDGRATATSVHAYSPPMPAMTYYRNGDGGPVAQYTEYRSDPAWAP